MKSNLCLICEGEVVDREVIANAVFTSGPHHLNCLRFKACQHSIPALFLYSTLLYYLCGITAVTVQGKHENLQIR